MILNPDNSAPTIEEALDRLELNGTHLPYGTDKATAHSYGPVYEALKRLMPEPKSIVEVGVWRGGSLLLWQDVFPTARVVGIDCNNSVPQSMLERFDSERTKFVVGNGYEEAIAERAANLVGGTIDIVIDDGPHTLESQQRFLDLYLPLLSAGGVAIIEDILNPDWLPSLQSRVREGWKSQVLDLRLKKLRLDDIMLIVRRPFS